MNVMKVKKVKKYKKYFFKFLKRHIRGGEGYHKKTIFYTFLFYFQIRPDQARSGQIRPDQARSGHPIHTANFVVNMLNKQEIMAFNTVNVEPQISF